MGLLGADQAGQLPVVAGGQRGVAGRAEHVADVPEHLGLVVHHEDGHRLPSPMERPLRRRRPEGRTGLFGHRHRESEPGAAAHPGALGPDAPAVGLDQPLADGQAEAAPETGSRVAADGVLLEEVRELLRRDAPALVGDRNRHGIAIAAGGDPDGRRLGGVPGRVREEVVQDLNDALPVGHHAGQVLRQVGGDRVPAAAAEETRPRRVHQHRHLRGFGRDRERARRDAPRIQQVPDQTAHPGRLLVYDAEELHHFGPGESRLGGEHRARRSLDRGERRAQLVTHDREELRPHPLERLEWGEVLYRDHDRLDFAVRRMNRRRVDQHSHAPAIGHRELDFLGANRHAGQLPVQREVRQGDLAPVGPPTGDKFGQLLGGAIRHPQALDDPFRLAVQ